LLVPARRASAEIREKRSRFLATVIPVDGEAEAREAVGRTAEEARDATHVCFAYRLGQGPLERAGDAGEPAGTAGRPILEAIRERRLADCLVVVVRWFGGTKLGKGGLARAYRDAARAALEASGTREVPLLVSVAFEVDVAAAGRMHAVVAQAGGNVVEERYQDDRARFEAQVPEESRDRLCEALREATAGAVRFPGEGG